jgi:hypothetical protein
MGRSSLHCVLLTSKGFQFENVVEIGWYWFTLSTCIKVVVKFCSQREVKTSLGAFGLKEPVQIQKIQPRRRKPKARMTLPLRFHLVIRHLKSMANFLIENTL